MQISIGNKQKSLIVKKKFQNKHSKGSQSTEAISLMYDPLRIREPSPEGIRGHQVGSRLSKCRRWRTKIKNRSIKKYYQTEINDELCAYDRTSKDDYFIDYHHNVQVLPVSILNERNVVSVLCFCNYT